MSSYKVATAIALVKGYYKPRPGEKPESAFVRAQEEAQATLAAWREGVCALNYTDFEAAKKRGL